MEVAITQKSKDILSVAFSYKNQYVNVTRWITLNAYEDHKYLKSWIDICNKTFFKDALPGVMPVFWNDEEDTNFVCTQFMENSYFIVIRLPFEECRSAFEKVRDAYQNLISGKIKSLDKFPTDLAIYRNIASVCKCPICLHIKSLV